MSEANQGSMLNGREEPSAGLAQEIFGSSVSAEAHAAQMEQTQKQIDALNRIIREDSAKLAEKQEYIAYLEQEISVLKRENIVLQRPVSKQNVKLESEFMEEQSRNIKSIDQLRLELDDCRAELRQKDLEIAFLKRENEDEASMLKNAEFGLIEHSETVKQESAYFDEQNERSAHNFEVEISEVEGVYQEVREERDELKKSIISISKDNIVLRSQLTQAEAQLAESMSATERLEASMRQLKQTKKAMAREFRDLEYLSSQISTGSDMAMLFESNEQLAEMRVKMVEMEQDLLSSETVESQLRSQIESERASHEHEIASLRGHLEASNIQARFDVEQEEETVEELAELLARTQHELEVIKSRVVEPYEEAENASPSGDDIRSRLKEVQDELQLINLDFESKDAEIRRRDEQIHRLQSLNEALSLRLTETAPVAERLETLDGDLDVDELEMSVIDLMQENKRLRDELALLKSQSPNLIDE